MAGLRVFPPFDPRGTAVLHGLIGAATTLPMWIAGRPLVVPTLFMVLVPSGWWIVRWICSAIGLLLPIGLAAWLSLRCSQRRPVFWAGFAFGACQAASAFLALAVPRQPVLTTGLLGSTLDMLAVAATIAAVGAACGLAYLVVHWILRQAWYEIAVQDGALCWTCAYRVGDPPISDRCPECGTPVRSRGRRARGPGPVRRFMKRHARRTASLALLCGAAIVLAREITGGIAMSPFNRNVTGTFVRGAVAKIDRSGPVPRWFGFWEADGKWRPIPGDPSKALVVYYLPRARGDQPSMQVQLTGLFTSGVAAVPSWGNPAISCDLARDQAAHVLEHDVPQSLIDAMLQEAVNSGWVPMPAGGVVTCVEVSPDGHFP